MRWTANHFFPDGLLAGTRGTLRGSLLLTSIEQRDAMPILGCEPSIYPEDLLGDVAPVGADVDRRWWGLYTKPRQEKPLARDLFHCHVPFNLPLIRKRMIDRGRHIQSALPLFSGYLFLCGSDEERLRAIATDRVSQLVTVHDADRLIHDLQSLQRLIRSDAALTLESQLRPGRRVRVTSGPLLDLEGTIQSCQDGFRLIVGVQLLQQGVSLEIGDGCFELLLG